jgi:rifampin ADP-ribosylating transferase
MISHDVGFHHGARRAYGPGDLIEPTQPEDGVEAMPCVHLSRDLDGAIWAAELAAGREMGRVYRVEASGPIEPRELPPGEAAPRHPWMAWRTFHPVRVVEEVVEWPLYHGTRADLKPGDLIGPGRTANFGAAGRVANHVYMTRTLDAAKWGAELAVGDGPGRIYRVAPLGPIEDDPNLTDKKFRGNPTGSFRSRDPVRVVDEVLVWEGHAPEAVQAMRDGLARLQEHGEAVIDD